MTDYKPEFPKKSKSKRKKILIDRTGKILGDLYDDVHEVLQIRVDETQKRMLVDVLRADMFEVHTLAIENHDDPSGDYVEQLLEKVNELMLTNGLKLRDDIAERINERLEE